MKSSLKIIVAALALASAGGAFAQTAPSNANGSDVYFYAFDSTVGSSFIIDLGSNFSNAASLFNGPTTSFNFGANSAYQQYAASAAADGGGLWAVVSAASIGAGPTQITGLDVTNGSATVAGTKGKVVTNQIANFTNLMFALNGNVSTTAITGGFFDSAKETQNANYTIGGMTGLTGGVSVANAVGTTATLLGYSAVGPTGNALVIPSQFSDKASFDGTSLTFTSQVAAVPEPSGYMMMLGGLLMVGAMVARRRNSK